MKFVCDLDFEICDFMKIPAILFSALIVLSISSPAHAFWLWNPKTKKFFNPKYSTQKPPVQQFNDAMKLYESKQYELAFQEFQKLFKSYPQVREAAEAQYYAGRCLEEMGEHYAAFEHYQMVINKYPFSERAGDIIERQYNLGNKYVEYLRSSNAFLSIMRGSMDKATEIYETVIKNAPYGDYAGAAQFKIGEYLWSRGWYDEARDAFQKTVDDYPNSVWAKQARYQLALTDKKRSMEYAHDSKTGQEAIEQFEQVIEMNPEASEEARKNIDELRFNEARHQFEVGVFYEKQEKYNAAKMYYQKVIDRYPQTSWAKDAAGKIEALPKP